MSGAAIAWRIETERLVLRPWHVEDAPALKAAIDASLEHLRPWMPWAEHEPVAVEEKAGMIEGWVAGFAAGGDLPYGMFARADARVLGSTGLHDRVEGNAREIGYWVHADFEGQGLVTEAAAALTRVGFEVMGLQRLEIHCDPRNVRSAAVPERLGYRLQGIVPEPDPARFGGRETTMIWSLDAVALAETRSATAQLRALAQDGTVLLDGRSGRAGGLS